jgi:CIC family chloride channel protein
MRKVVIRYNYFKLLLASLVVGFISTLFADSLKKITGFFQEHIFEKVSSYPYLFLILPSVGITIIYFLRKFAFKNKQNKGIKEIYKTIETRKDDLPLYKIPSHYVNGFFTVIFGGSTGIEVSTVVASATVGAAAHKKGNIAFAYKTELICAGVAAGVATLFGSPIAGLLFAIEVIAKKANKAILISCVSAALVSWIYLHFTGGGTLFQFQVSGWNMYAIPYFVVLSLLAGILAVYFTKSVIFIKARFARIENNFLRVNIGAILVGLSIFFLPQLYGDSYHGITALLQRAQLQETPLFFAGILLVIACIKPLAAALTLGAGGDGGVFAPSIVAGAVLGMLVAFTCNHLFNAHLIVLNFALVGAAAMLSSAIHAPFTALFLTCSIVTGGYIIFVPILIGSFIAKFIAKYLYKYTVYTYKEAKPVKVLK